MHWRGREERGREGRGKGGEEEHSFLEQLLLTRGRAIVPFQIHFLLSSSQRL